MNRAILIVAAASVAVALAACGGSGGGVAPTGNLVGVSVTSSTSVGDFTPSVTPSVGDDGTLKLTLAGIDADNDGNIETPAVTNVVASSVTAVALVAEDIANQQVSCDSGRPIGSGGADVFDIGICLDTTSSMGGAAGVLANKVAAFASELAASGIDPNFIGITMGDSFATKSGTSEYTDPVSRGTLGTPATFGDEPERPDTGITPLPPEQMQTFFTEVARVIGSGEGGDDEAENYLGCLNWMNNAASWTPAAGRVMISIGDSCSHTPTSQSFIVGPTAANEWSPPAGAALANALTGVATVHVIGPQNPLCTDSAYDMTGLATATGGTFTEIGDCSTEASCNVDLASLPLAQSITGGIVYLCDGRLATYGGSGSYTLVISTRTVGAGGDIRNAVTTMVVELLFN